MLWVLLKLFKLKLTFVYFSVALEVHGYLTLRCSLKLAPRVHSIRASFCPLLSLEKGEFIGMFFYICGDSYTALIVPSYSLRLLCIIQWHNCHCLVVVLKQGTQKHKIKFCIA